MVVHASSCASRGCVCAPKSHGSSTRDLKSLLFLSLPCSLLPYPQLHSPSTGSPSPSRAASRRSSDAPLLELDVRGPVEGLVDDVLLLDELLDHVHLDGSPEDELDHVDHLLLADAAEPVFALGDDARDPVDLDEDDGV